MKLAAQQGQVPPEVARLVNTLAASAQTDLQQRCREFLALIKRGPIMVQVLPVDARYVITFIMFIMRTS